MNESERERKGASERGGERERVRVCYKNESERAREIEKKIVL